MDDGSIKDVLGCLYTFTSFSRGQASQRLPWDPIFSHLTEKIGSHFFSPFAVAFLYSRRIKKSELPLDRAFSRDLASDDAI